MFNILMYVFSFPIMSLSVFTLHYTVCFLHRPLDFLGIDHNRLAVSAIFSVAVVMIIQVVLSTSNIQINNSNWLRGKVQACTVIVVIIRKEWRHGVMESVSGSSSKVGRQGGRGSSRQVGREAMKQGVRRSQGEVQGSIDFLFCKITIP